MDKAKGKKKESAGKSSGKVTKKKVSSKKTEKSTKKKKTIKNGVKNKKIDHNEKGAESNNITDNNEKGEEKNIEDKLNQPLSKKKLPPIQKNNNENEEIPNEPEELKEEEKKEENVEIEKEEIKIVESSVGTPYFYNINGLKNELEERNKIINEENNDQEKYKTSLNNLLNDLNKILSENVELLYNDQEDEAQKRSKKILIIYKIFYFHINNK